jgi:hypothetical protein
VTACHLIWFMPSRALDRLSRACGKHATAMKTPPRSLRVGGVAHLTQPSVYSVPPLQRTPPWRNPAYSERRRYPQFQQLPNFSFAIANKPAIANVPPTPAGFTVGL